MQTHGLEIDILHPEGQGFDSSFYTVQMKYTNCINVMIFPPIYTFKIKQNTKDFSLHLTKYAYNLTNICILRRDMPGCHCTQQTHTCNHGLFSTITTLISLSPPVTLPLFARLRILQTYHHLSTHPKTLGCCRHLLPSPCFSCMSSAGCDEAVA